MATIKKPNKPGLTAVCTRQAAKDRLDAYLQNLGLAPKLADATAQAITEWIDRQEAKSDR